MFSNQVPIRSVDIVCELSPSRKEERAWSEQWSGYIALSYLVSQLQGPVHISLIIMDIAILLIDPYNDFLHPDGKLNARLRDSLEKSDTISNLHKLLKVARSKKVPIFYCMHQQTHTHVMEGWTKMNPSLARLKANQVFQEGSWGSQYFDGMAPVIENGDVIISKHWNSRYELFDLC